MIYFWRRAHMSSLSGGARLATGARRKEAGQLEQHLLIQKPGRGGRSRNFIETTTATNTRNIASPFLAPSSYVESLWRRAAGYGRASERGRPTGAALAHPIHHHRACGSNRNEGGYCVERPKKGPRHRGTWSAAYDTKREQPSAKRSPVQHAVNPPARSPACGTLL